VFLWVLTSGCSGPEPGLEPREEAPAQSAPPTPSPLEPDSDADSEPEGKTSTPVIEQPPPPKDSAVPTGEVDVFGTSILYPSAPGGRTWAAKWNENPRTLSNPQTDPLDSEFHVRGSHQKLEIPGNGLARSWGDIVRLYIGTWGLSWLNIELTVYEMRVAEQDDAPGTAGFEFQTRTRDGHRGDDNRLNHRGLDKRCDGHAYSYALRFDGRVVLQKELKHPFYTSQITTQLWEGQPLPSDQWVGIKVITYNLPGDAVKLELWVDLTDGESGGHWEKVHEYIDAGGWSIDEEEAASCKIAPDHRITTPQPFVVIRNDGVREQWLKKLTIREIQPPPQ